MTSMSSFDRTGLALTLYPPVDVDRYRTAAARLPVSRGNTPSENAGARRFNNPLQRRLFNIAQWIRAESSEVALFSDKIPRSFDAVRTDPTVYLTGVAIMNTLNTAVSRVAESL